MGTRTVTSPAHYNPGPKGPILLVLMAIAVATFYAYTTGGIT